MPKNLLGLASAVWVAYTDFARGYLYVATSPTTATVAPGCSKPEN
jgi:hypothetical protein